MTAIKLKKSIQSVLAGLMVMTALPIMASSGNSKSGNGDAILTKKFNESFRKRTPSTMFIQIIYIAGIVSVSSDYYSGGFSLSFENYETGAIYEIPCIQIGESAPLSLEIGEYQLTAVGEDGTELIGFMQVY